MKVLLKTRSEKTLSITATTSHQPTFVLLNYTRWATFPLPAARAQPKTWATPENFFTWPKMLINCWILQIMSFQHWEYFPLLYNPQAHMGLQHPVKVRSPLSVLQRKRRILVQAKKFSVGYLNIWLFPWDTWNPELLYPLMPVCFSHQLQPSGQAFINDSHFPFYAQWSWAVIRQLSTALCKEPSPSSGGCCHHSQLAMLVPSHALIQVDRSQTLLPTFFSPEL